LGVDAVRHALTGLPFGTLLVSEMPKSANALSEDVCESVFDEQEKCWCEAWDRGCRCHLKLYCVTAGRVLMGRVEVREFGVVFDSRPRRDMSWRGRLEASLAR
jgi:hypothetical protein